ncbi:MAG TPA: acyl carrier protein [bacterium]
MSTSALEQGLIAKLAQGRPVAFTIEESRWVTEALRSAMAVVLDCPPSKITDDARVFDDLALDSIDVFDLLDQLAERFESPVELEHLPPELVRGTEGMTFAQFAQGILQYFRSAPPPPRVSAAS